MNRKTMLSLFMAVLMLFAFSPAAHADLTAIGQVDPVTGFPAYVQDIPFNQLAPCDVPTPELSPGCPGLELVDPAGAFEIGNILEFTYYRTEANIEPDATPDGSRYRMRIEVQGGVLPPEVVGNGMRIRLRNLTQIGIYTVISPFGVFEFEAVADATGAIPDIDEEAIGTLGNPPDYAETLVGPIQCFWGNGTGFTDGTNTFLGDAITALPLIAEGGCPQIASNGIFDQVDDGELEFVVVFPDGTVVGTDLFTVEGKLAPELGFIVERATYERNAGGNNAKADIWVSSIPGQAIVVSGGTAQLRTGSGERTMLEDAANPGRYYLRQRLNELAGIPIPPDPINVLINGRAVELVDEVSITRARHDVNSNLMDLTATSSDRFGVDALLGITFKDEYGNPLTSGGLAPSNVAVRQVTAESVGGGTDTEDVDVRGGNVFQ